MRARGFTLLELLVALAIFAFLGVMAYGGLAAMLRMGEGTSAAREDLATLQRNVRLLEEDMAFVLARPVRDGLGSPHLAFMSGRDGTTLLEFSRATRPLEGLFPSPIERVRYVLADGALLRQSWNPPDAARLEPDQTQPLWPAVETVSLRFVDRQQQSFTSWPPPNVEQPGLPRAVEWTLQPKGQAAMRLLLPLPELPPPGGGKP
ncbi:type II secretion system minor pseudopilin GspJ [Thiofaba sp. EF100]|uniref:type II secretion system minor pseudopilin GspJ n=1 Tax=Thiofaba sp. EF100 TaxID=3121274 RepID=UPI003221CCC3